VLKMPLIILNVQPTPTKNTAVPKTCRLETATTKLP